MRSLMPLTMTATTRLPSTASTMRPCPPNREVPPMTAAPTASSIVFPAPALDCTDRSKDAATRPEIAAMPEQMTNTEIPIADAATPARRCGRVRNRDLGVRHLLRHGRDLRPRRRVLAAVGAV